MRKICKIFFFNVYKSHPLLMTFPNYFYLFKLIVFCFFCVSLPSKCHCEKVLSPLRRTHFLSFFFFFIYLSSLHLSKLKSKFINSIIKKYYLHVKNFLESGKLGRNSSISRIRQSQIRTAS